MLILDTNVVSEFMRDAPNPVVLAWLDRQDRHSVWITAISIMELNFGIHALPPGRRKTVLRRGLDRLATGRIGDRIAVFDAGAAISTAVISAERRRAGRPGELRDSMIAGIALSTGASLATRNTGHFADVAITLIDPWAA
nr:type II toxin-antitoxin system VapC family toxin [uncultured Rhodopila sp.]